MRRAGVPGAQIAALFGVTRHAIYHRLEKFPEYKRLSEVDKTAKRKKGDEAIAMLDEGLTTDDVRDIQGWTEGGLYSLLHRRGVYVTRGKFLPESSWEQFAAGASTEEIARTFDVKKITVRRGLMKLHPEEYARIVQHRKGGRKAGTRLGNRWDVHEGFNQYRSGATIRGIAQYYHMTAGAISSAFRIYYGDEYKILAAERLKYHRLDSGQRSARRIALRKANEGNSQ